MARKPAPREGARAFFQRQGLLVRQPIELATHHFLLTHLAAAGFVVREIARQSDPCWSLHVSAVEGAGRRGFKAVRGGINSAVQALGSGNRARKVIIDRARNRFDVAFLCDAGSAGAVRVRRGRIQYVVGKPLG